MSTVIAYFPWGYIAVINDNEIEIVSSIPDPAKIRFAIMAAVLRPNTPQNVGSVSFGVKRDDGVHEEYGQVGCRLSEDHQQGSMYLTSRGRGEDEVHERLLINDTGAVFNVDVSAPNLTGGGVFPKTVALRSRANGKLLCVDMAQRDANGDPKTVANRPAVGPWEMFDVVIVE